ncbi:MAG: hypothetical protein KI790_20585, partial [Cyclobacteriaceae bacterium]|nr:hypothetical protein [Cyclobacteriaceae bacterium HetDA_MAG_MS6]
MISTFQKHAILLMSTLAILARCQKPDNSLVVSMSEKPDINELIAYYEGFDRGGNTSVDHDADVVIKGSAQGGWGYYDTAGQEQQYYKRNRDLGQTFRISGTEPSYLKSITVRTGFGSNVVRPNIYGKALSLQILEVEGDAVLNDNGTDSTMSAFHGFPGDRMGRGIPHERDDYYTGETYHSMGVFSGGTFPSKTDFGIAENEDVPADHPKVKGRYLKFVLPENSGILLHPGRHYAF